ncbi:MAG TPA: zinc dependent phospholipase C family protein, partial [Bryobacteraceae bacterium]
MAARVIVVALLATSISSAYSVLTHEAIVDSAWDASIQKLLLKRFPAATPEDLEKAHAYVYGGCIIQDMGYYPFSSRLFSDLTHYVRSGDFVLALIRESQDINEYAFALGALAHYAADNNGHRIATNQAVPILYPELRTRFGKTVTYWDDPLSHIRTEFSFDVLQVARGRYAP